MVRRDLQELGDDPALWGVVLLPHGPVWGWPGRDHLTDQLEHALVEVVDEVPQELIMGLAGQALPPYPLYLPPAHHNEIKQ